MGQLGYIQKTIPMRWYGDKIGWVIEAHKGMTPTEIQRCIDFTLQVQTQRLFGLRPGTLKDECKRTIEDLKIGKVHVNIAGIGERVLFDSYKQQKKYWYPDETR